MLIAVKSLLIGKKQQILAKALFLSSCVQTVRDKDAEIALAWDKIVSAQAKIVSPEETEIRWANDEIDLANYEIDLAKAEIGRAKAEIDSATAGIDSAKAGIGSANDEIKQSIDEFSTIPSDVTIDVTVARSLLETIHINASQNNHQKMQECKAELEKLFAPLTPQAHVAASSNVTDAPSMFSLFVLVLCFFPSFFFCFLFIVITTTHHVSSFSLYLHLAPHRTPLWFVALRPRS